MKWDRRLLSSVSEQSLGQILEAAVSVGSRTLEPQLDSLLAALHAQVGCTGTGAAVGGACGCAGWGSPRRLQGASWGQGS